MGLNLVPLGMKDANEMVRRFHRHHKPLPVGYLFAIGAANDMGVVVAASIVGRPAARHLDDGFTAEVRRLVTNGEKNAASMLYAASWRAARAMGFRRLITYILQSEPGTSLKAASWRLVGETGGGSWSRPSRRRLDKHPLQRKLLYETGTVRPAAPSPGQEAPPP